MPPQRKGTTRPLSLVDAKCNTEQLTRKSCPIPDLGNKGTSFPPPWQTHHTPSAGSAHLPCEVSQPAGPWGQSLLQNREHRGHCLETASAWCDLQRAWISKDCVQHILAVFNSKEKFNKAIDTRRTVSELSYTHWSFWYYLKTPPDLRSKQDLYADFWGLLRQHSTAIKACEL